MTRVLIVEPDESLLRMMGWLLIDAGMAVVCATDFDEALQRIWQVRPDVTLLDGDSTEDMCADPVGAVRARWRDGRVVELRHLRTQHPVEITTADATLMKPLHADSLIDAVRELSAARERRASSLALTAVAEDISGGALPPSELWKRSHKQHRRDA